jgi:hypothetical protein
MDAMHPDAAQHPAQSRASVAALWAGSQTRSGAAIHDEGQRAAICLACHAFHLTADAANSKIFVRGVEDRDACAS